ncbi:hypothetical protein RJP56_16390 [Shewanella baltica]|uniref:Uncharacterized protein n=1 Tax=Shewanella baltica (strain OS155 / ATCC BAA-1091) TaxID=325240 RepID=A3D9X3_SHEB5|nr:hypothetical protein [Shewanella baltica]ABN63536.1 hypothetical protein Sbal_4070 [Shewanella baltica OS155]AEH15880.1 hypothetical protein Sbal117_4227 [Shewanella baltica OS117]MDR9767641.1 hypothetical protein [Shewanella baltica]
MKIIDYLVQVTNLPSDLLEASQNTKSELYRTYRVYKLLIDSKLLWKVWLLDEYEQVWLEVNFINCEGKPEFHTVSLDKGTYQEIGFDSYTALSSLE